MRRPSPTDLPRTWCDGCVNTNADFDHVYPDWVRSLSERHWTPVDVAERAAELLVTSAGVRVLDVGSGAGKFCIIGALTTEGKFCGIEQRAHLIDVAREAARHYDCLLYTSDAADEN